MWGFLFGVILGVLGKTVYDLFKEEQLPVTVPFNSGRLEALLDETRQMVRDLREEVRQVLESGRSRAERLLGAHEQQPDGTAPRAETPTEPASSAGQDTPAAQSNPANESPASNPAKTDLGPRPTRGTPETMS